MRQCQAPRSAGPGHATRGPRSAAHPRPQALSRGPCARSNAIDIGSRSDRRSWRLGRVSGTLTVGLATCTGPGPPSCRRATACHASHVGAAGVPAPGDQQAAVTSVQTPAPDDMAAEQQQGPHPGQADSLPPAEASHGDGNGRTLEVGDKIAPAQPRTTQSGLPIVPWGTGKIVQVMVLWLLAYIIIGQVAVPVGLSLLGLDRDELSVRGHAVLHLCLDLSQLSFTLGILWLSLRQYKPLARGLFPFRLRGAWPLVVLAACLVFPGVDWIAQQSMSWFPVDADTWASHMEASLSVGDWVTNVAYFSVVSICAPIWEEAIFRGFLLTSLARYMSPPAAVAASSLLFAMCHFRLQTFLPLLALGVVFSAIFLITRNLLPPMVLHSAWNVFVLANLLLPRPG